MGANMEPQVGMPIVVMSQHDGITYVTGQVVGVNPTYIALSRCVWHRQTGRHGEFFAGAESPEREAYPREQIHVFRRADIPRYVLDWPGELDLETA